MPWGGKPKNGLAPQNGGGRHHRSVGGKKCRLNVVGAISFGEWEGAKFVGQKKLCEETKPETLTFPPVHRDKGVLQAWGVAFMGEGSTATGGQSLAPRVGACRIVSGGRRGGGRSGKWRCGGGCLRRRGVSIPHYQRQPDSQAPPQDLSCNRVARTRFEKL